MNSSTIVRLHRLIGMGMDPGAVSELASDHIESHERRSGLPVRSHAEFLVNNLVRRFGTSPAADLGAHFLPALLLTGIGMAIYLGGGQGAKPGAPPTWTMVPLVLGLASLAVQTARASGFPTRSAIAPALLFAFGAVADAMVMPTVLPEDDAIRLGLVIFAVTCPLVFVRLGAKTRRRLSWTQIRGHLATDSVLRVIWRFLSLSLVLLAVGEMVAIMRFELPGSFRVGAVIAGVGLAWMARSFHLAARTARTC
jgi:hypothetical protein